jgi:hypothetical protein
VERDDRPAVERWLAAETAARDTDPLAPLAARGVPPALRDGASRVEEGELMTTWLAAAWLSSSDPGVKTELLRRIDGAAALRFELERDLQRVASAPRSLALSKLAVGGGGQAAQPASVFAPDEPAIRIRFAYEHAVAGEALSARWLLRVSGESREVGRSSAALPRVADVAELSLAPAGGARWAEGAYRVEISGRGAVLQEVDFVVEGPRAASERKRPDVAGARPAPAPAPPPAVAALPPARPESPRPAGPVIVLDAALARDVAGGDPRDLVVEFTTARRRLLLWARAQSERGGALTARWYTRDGGDRLLGEHTLTLSAGESKIAFWLEPTDSATAFRSGPMRVDLVADGRVLKSIDFRIREANFLEGMNERLGQFSRELDKLIRGEAR